MAGTVHERVLAAEMLVVLGAQTADALSGAYPSGPTSTGTDATSNQSTGAKLPDPGRYFAAVVVYLSLAAVAMFGEKPGRLAGAFGGVAALAILLAPTKASKAAGKPSPLIMSVLNYANQIMSGGVGGVGTGGSGTGASTPTTGPNSPAGLIEGAQGTVNAFAAGHAGTAGSAGTSSLSPISPTNLAPPLGQ